MNLFSVSMKMGLVRYYYLIFSVNFWGKVQKKIIQQLYYGNISPDEQSIIAGFEYAKANSLAIKLYYQLKEKLNNEEAQLLDKLTDANTELNGIYAMEKFCNGFRLGIRIASESFIDSSDNFDDKS